MFEWKMLTGVQGDQGDQGDSSGTSRGNGKQENDTYRLMAETVPLVPLVPLIQQDGGGV